MPQGFLRLASVRAASPGISETRFVWVKPPASARKLPAARAPMTIAVAETDRLDEDKRMGSPQLFVEVKGGQKKSVQRDATRPQSGQAKAQTGGVRAAKNALRRA